jgi:hypothetical protein
MIVDEQIALLSERRGATVAASDGICEYGVSEVRGMYVLCFSGSNGDFST